MRLPRLLWARESDQIAITPSMSENYVVYSFLGRADTEAQKLCRWPQWEPSFELFDELLAPFGKSASITSRQVFVIPLKPLKGDKPGTFRSTNKKVPGLARMGWSRENNRKWSQKLDEHEPHSIDLHATSIVSSTKGDDPDLCILLGDQRPLTFPDGRPLSDPYPFNQSLTFSVSQRMHANRDLAYWDDLVTKLATLSSAIRVGRAIRPWVCVAWEHQAGDASPTRFSSHLGFGSFIQPRDPLNFHDRFQTWEYLK
jgi:hypothetical protein